MSQVLVKFCHFELTLSIMIKLTKTFNQLHSGSSKDHLVVAITKKCQRPTCNFESFICSTSKSNNFKSQGIVGEKIIIQRTFGVIQFSQTGDQSYSDTSQCEIPKSVYSGP